MKVYIVIDISNRIVGVFDSCHVAQFWIEQQDNEEDCISKYDFQIEEWEVKNNPK